MTVHQCAVFLQSMAQHNIDCFKQNAILLDGAVKQLLSGISGMLDKKSKYITLNKLYKQLFANETKSKQQTETEAWHTFLFGR